MDPCQKPYYVSFCPMLGQRTSPPSSGFSPCECKIQKKIGEEWFRLSSETPTLEGNRFSWIDKSAVPPLIIFEDDWDIIGRRDRTQTDDRHELTTSFLAAIDALSQQTPDIGPPDISEEERTEKKRGWHPTIVDID